MLQRLRLFPLNTVLFPGAVLNLHVFEPRYKQLISECLDDGSTFGVVLIREGDEAGDPDVDPHRIGCTAEIADVTPLPFGRFYISTTGKRRFRIHDIISREPYLLVEAELLEEDATDDERVAGLRDDLRERFAEYLRMLVEYSGAHAEIAIPDDPRETSYIVADALQVADSIKQQLLEIESLADRLEAEVDVLRKLLPQLRLLLERKKSAPAVERDDPPGGSTRSQQEKFFGKYFSAN